MASYADELTKGISKKDSTSWEKGSAEDWANESLAVAVSIVYGGVRADGDPPNLDKSYVDRGADAIDLQLRKAGVRLAKVLNRVATGG